MSTTDTDDEIWAQDTITVNDDGHVEGTAVTEYFHDGHYVTASVSSYDYERRGKEHTNHVPIINVCDESGRIVDQPEAHDSESPRAAIESAKDTAEMVFKHPEEFID